TLSYGCLVHLCQAPLPPPFPYTTLSRSAIPGRKSPLLAAARRPNPVDHANRRHRAAPARPDHWPTLTAAAGALHSAGRSAGGRRSEEHTSELQSRENLVCRLLLDKTKTN